MTSGLKATIFASTGLAAMLNVIQISTDYQLHAQSAFVPTWAETGPPAVAGSPTSTHKVVKAPAVTPVAAAPVYQPPATDPAAAAAARLSAAGLNPAFAASYLAVQARTGTPWQLLAAVHRVETGQSGDTARKSYAGATGPMQFMPATFAHYAQDGDLNGTKDITDFDDALLSAGRYLAAGGADKGKYNTALYNYNHSNAYVAQVLTIARRLGL